MKIGFIGLGNMAQAMIGGILTKGLYQKQDIIGSCKTEETAKRIREQFGIAAGTDNRKTADEAEVIVLAVKPIFLQEVITEIRDLMCIRDRFGLGFCNSLDIGYLLQDLAI